LYLGNGEKSPNRLDEIVKTYQFWQKTELWSPLLHFLI
jgi:hypothetical protein